MLYIHDEANSIEQIVFTDNLFSVIGAANTCTIAYNKTATSTGTVVINSTGNGVEITAKVKEALKKIDGGGAATVDMEGLDTTGTGIVFTA